ncbi:ATP-dependent nuclease [Sphaerisporangium rhizosphaerae]|uniref:ATP-dependent endonuclease n=1 Tax=Sphaerisporangium rhizosphaerae TaxID=2269375 RepID=A0ABW2PCG8_9ACTN
MRLHVRNIRAVQDLKIHLRRFGALIAANNAGKSTVLDAIRLFYGDLDWEPRRDLPWRHDGGASFVEVEYELDDEEAEELTEHADGACLTVRRYFGDRPGAAGLVAEDRRTDVHYAIRRGESPLAWRSPAIGRCVYVPAAARLSDYTTLAGSSPLRDILEASTSGLRIAQAVSEIEVSLARLREALLAEANPVTTMSDRLGDLLGAWKLKPEIALAELTPDTILRHYVELRLTADGQDMPLDAQGMGVQRAIIVGLIQIAAELRGRAGYTKASDLRWVVFEEPELYLHPAQIAGLARDLHELAAGPATAVTITTHDPTMLASAADGIDSLVRLYRSGGGVAAAFLAPDDVDSALDRVDERSRYAQAAQRCFRQVPPSRSRELRRARLLSELDGQRAAAFFADRVIVVEGFSDVVFFNWLRSKGLLQRIGANVGVLDAFGKYELHRAATTLSLFRIPHVVIWDGDAHGKTGDDLVRAACRDEAAWEALRAAANDPGSCTLGGIRLAGAVETWLGVDVEKSNAWKAGNLLAELNERFDLSGSLVRERAEALVAAIADLFGGRDMSRHTTAPVFAGCLLAPPFPATTRDFAAELRQLPLPRCRCVR